MATPRITLTDAQIESYATYLHTLEERASDSYGRGYLPAGGLPREHRNGGLIVDYPLSVACA